MQTETTKKPWYAQRRNLLILVTLLVILLVISFYPQLPASPKKPNQVRLDRTIAYFVRNYNPTIGLVSETPGSNTYWLYSDNYLAALAIMRYNPGNQSTSEFGSALDAALAGYAATLPSSLAQNQYAVLNSTVANFGCSSDFVVSWSHDGRLLSGNGSVVLKTTANNQTLSCASRNYADLLLLQALYYHRVGNSTGAASFYQHADRDFDGVGFQDIAYTDPNSTSYHSYQTYKLALYVYTTYCLGYQSTSTDLAKVTSILMYTQSNSSGGFATSYQPNLTALNAPEITPGQSVNTETTALGALALEEMISPSSAC